jgi:hypothetical protein
MADEQFTLEINALNTRIKRFIQENENSEHNEYFKRFLNTNWEAIELSKTATMNEVLANPNYPWDMFLLSSSSNITFEDLKQNKELTINGKKFNMFFASKNPNITPLNVIENPTFKFDGCSKSWNKETLSKHPNFVGYDINKLF